MEIKTWDTPSTLWGTLYFGAVFTQTWGLYADIYGKDLQKMENISKILQTKFKLLKELQEHNQVNGSQQSCSASNNNILNVPHVNIDFDDLD